MSEWYDRQGSPLPPMLDENGEFNPEHARAIEALLADRNYRVVRQTVGVLRGYKRKKALVSTVWLGLDYSFLGGPPLIFETMIFDRPEAKKKSSAHDYQERYSTEEDAIRRHEELVSEYLVEGTYNDM